MRKEKEEKEKREKAHEKVKPIETEVQTTSADDENPGPEGPDIK